jgi:N-acetylglucosaminyl-diphospho-decaprenol L-rhamnosyltransferase
VTSRQLTVDVVIVNWNAGERLRECLSALAESQQKTYRFEHITIVDNASTDRSADELAFPHLPIVVVRNSSNRGFGAACNQGASSSTADYVLFLNPDTRVFPTTLNDSIMCMETSERAGTGILGVQLIDDNGRVTRSCARFLATRYFIYGMLGLNRMFPTTFHGITYAEWDHAQSRQIEHVIGAYFLVRLVAFREIGGFDERFFVYYEDVDLSLRATKAGWSSYYLATVQCCHSGCGTSNQIKARRLFYSLRSRIVYAFKHFTLINAISLSLATLLIEPISRLGHALLRGSLTQAREIAEAYWLLVQSLPATLGSSSLRKADGLKGNPEVLH